MDHPYSLLLVDDEAANRLLLGKRLELDGHAVSTAENGRQALDMLQSERFDLVLLDMLMPDMDGMATLSAIKSDAALKDTMVVMLSSDDNQETAANCISLGATDYLTKPVDPVELKQRIRCCLEARQSA
jgi:CheY-like chemotaxis protein